MGKAKGSCSVDRETRDRFLRRQIKKSARHVHRQRRGEQGRGSWIAVGRNRNRHLVLAKDGDGRLLLLLQGIKGAGKQHCYGSCSCHCFCTRIIEMLEMIGGEGAVLRGKGRSMLVR